MSRTIRFAGEGPTDFVVLSAILMALGFSDAVLTQVQPPSDQLVGRDDQGRHGGGWRGVLSWAEAVAADHSLDLLLANGLLVIHIDCEVAGEPDFCNRIPERGTDFDSEFVANLVRERLGSQATREARVALMTPSLSTETWVFASLFGSRPGRDLERDEGILAELTQRKPKLVRKQDHRYRKVTKAYRAQAGAISAGWPIARALCTQAEEFTQKLLGHLDRASA